MLKFAKKPDIQYIRPVSQALTRGAAVEGTAHVPYDVLVGGVTGLSLAVQHHRLHQQGQLTHCFVTPEIKTVTTINNIIHILTLSLFPTTVGYSQNSRIFFTGYVINSQNQIKHRNTTHQLFYKIKPIFFQFLVVHSFFNWFNNQTLKVYIYFHHFFFLTGNQKMEDNKISKDYNHKS